MLLLIWLGFFLAAGFVMLLPLFLRNRDIYSQFSGSRLVACPENRQAAVVSVDARHAAESAVDGSPDLRLSCCTRWPERANCGCGCLSEAVQSEPYKEGKATPGRKPIYHLPIILAAFLAWYMGAIWHSHYMFRARWIDAAGLTHAQVTQLGWWLSPYLVAAAVCLLFAYGVAWLLAVRHRKGVLQGVLMAVLLCGALVATTWFGIARLPHGLLMIEAGYMLLATLIVGAVVGGLYNKLVLPSD